MMMIHKSSDKQIRLREFSSTDLSEKLLVLDPSPPKGDFSKEPNITLGLRVKFVIFLTSPPPGAQVSYTPPK
jgi:hypothetical protein